MKKVLNIGINDIEKGRNHILFNRWYGMLSRCYNENHKSYKNYGGNGCYVDERWLTFSNYIKDIENKENYDKLLKDSKNWHIDKDILFPGNKVYSNETTKIVSLIENVRERNLTGKSGGAKGKKVSQYTKDGQFIKTYNNMQQANEETGVHYSGISQCCLGKSKTAGKFIWKFEEI